MLIALVALLLGVSTAIRLPAIIAFALVAPGLAATRFLPPLDLSDRLAMTMAISMSLVILVSLLLVVLNRWSGSLTFAELACITTAFVLFPAPRAKALPGSSPDELNEERNKERMDEAKQRLASRTARPLAEVHRKARSQDPEERRQGLIDLARVLENEGEPRWAQELRAQAEELSVPPWR